MKKYILSMLSITIFLFMAIDRNAIGKDLNNGALIVYPLISETSKSIEGFVPLDWLVEKKLEGDLNNDGLNDLVLVLRKNDPKLIKQTEDSPVPFNTNPRILVVAIKSKENSSYKLILQNHKLIPRPDNPAFDDPFDSSTLVSGASIKKGILHIDLASWASSGTWYMSTSSYAFKYNNICFKLIGYDKNETHRTTLDFTNKSVNFLTNKAKITKGNESQDKEYSHWIKLKDNNGYCLDDINNGISFSPID
ncbi:hypothetical protein [Sulfuriferula nivalis]|uniref:Uncharacterized protein n=1 Tax=Sulfuriferula nivalis TaxID=2675298 RepID=A0A809SER9_9PROT|nr:hypothetical protein [Sulfuriferula nivalis]BBP01667.1 hypothetical protein SFSGTM_23750 [Sulfuriferula nivalis]